MDSDHTVEKVVEGLETTSDKIRALARSGYLRTEISKLLGIRYQMSARCCWMLESRAGLNEMSNSSARPSRLRMSKASAADTVECINTGRVSRPWRMGSPRRRRI